MAGASARAAGASIFTGGILFLADHFARCAAVNTSSRPLANVRVLLRNSTGTFLHEGVCAELAPLHTCPVAAVDDPGPGFVYCEVTSDRGGKTLRATLVNETTGGSSDAR